MKQHTTPEQTGKLIELGFEKPKSITHILEPMRLPKLNLEKAKEFLVGPIIQVEDNEPIYAFELEYIRNYSIGELLEMLPTYIERIDGILIDALLNIGYDFFKHCWVVAYIDDDEYKYRTSGSELIDALYDMVCKLKESGYARR